jgi:hypothetical protein
MPETLDWRIVTASPMEGFDELLLLAMAVARKARDWREASDWYWLALEITLENILL